MKWTFLFFFFSAYAVHFEDFAYEQKIVVNQKRIQFDDYPDATNPSIIQFKNGYLMSFRYSPDRYNDPWVSYIGLAILDEKFDLIAPAQIVDTRFKNNRTRSQCEDARLFTYQGRVFLTYNDNMEINCTSLQDKRNIFLTEVFFNQNKFTLGEPLKLIHHEKSYMPVEKNWIPFEWNKKLLITYSVNPHEILFPSLHDGVCYSCYKTQVPLDWGYGILRGSTPPILIDGEYLSFFHSGSWTSSYASWGWDMWHYFMGAYTFSASPPFEMTSYTPLPIVADGFYTQSNHEKRVIFPGGCVATDSAIYVAYGKDDYEIWIATIDKHELKKAMKSICKN